MLEVKSAANAGITGRGYINAAAAGLKIGCFVKLDGVWAAIAGPTGYAGKPGYAPIGGIKYTPATSGDDIATPVFPFKKYHYTPEDSELTKDTVVSGQEIVVFESGEFETDQYSVVMNATTVGTLLYIDASSQLTTGFSALNRVPRAIFLGSKGTSFDSNYEATGLIWFKLLPPAIVPSGWAQKHVA